MFFFFGFSLIFEVVSVVINLFFVCSAIADYCLLTALAETRKKAALHTSVFIALALLVIFSEKVSPDIQSVILQMHQWPTDLGSNLRDHYVNLNLSEPLP